MSECDEHIIVEEFYQAIEVMEEVIRET